MKNQNKNKTKNLKIFRRSDIHCHGDEILKVALEKLNLHLWVCFRYVAAERCLPKELNKLFLSLPWKTYAFNVKTKQTNKPKTQHHYINYIVAKTNHYLHVEVHEPRALPGSP